MQTLAKGSVWVNIDRDIEEMVKSCAPFSCNQHINLKEPLKPHNIPQKPDNKLGCENKPHWALNYLRVHHKWGLQLQKLHSADHQGLSRPQTDWTYKLNTTYHYLSVDSIAKFHSRSPVACRPSCSIAFSLSLLLLL